MTETLVCPQCHGTVELSWEFCHRCGFDPQGRRPADWRPGDDAMAPVVPPDAPPPFSDRLPTEEGSGRTGDPLDGWGAARGRLSPDHEFDPNRFAASRRGLRDRLSLPSFGGDVNPVVGITAVVVAGVIIVAAALSSATRDDTPQVSATGSTPPPLGIAVGTDPPTTLPASSTSTVVPTDQWTPFQAPDGTFQVDLPGPPRQETAEIQLEGARSPVPYTQFLAEAGDRSAVVAYYDLPPRFTRPDGYLENALIGALFSSGGRLSDYRLITTPEGKSGIEGFIVLKDSSRLRVRVIDADSRLFVLAFRAPLNADAEWQHFASSFALAV